MSDNFMRVRKGLNLTPSELPISGRLGDLILDQADGNLKTWNGTTWEPVGSSSGGVRNFLQESDISWDAETGTTGFVAYKDSATSRPEDGTGGSPTLTITTSSTNPLTGDNSLIITKSASNLQGEGISADFTIDRANQARVLKVEFDYIVNSGTFVAGTPTTDSDLIVYLYDVTNSRLIEPSSFKLFSNSTTTSDKFSGYFQTSADSTSYRLILHIASTSTSAFSLKLDSLTVTPSTYVYGTPITDWQSYTPTIAVGSGTFPTNTSSFYWRRVGDSLEVRFKITFTGTNTWSAPTFTIPAGLTMDTTKLTLDGTAGLGIATLVDTGTAGYAGVVAKAASDTAFRVYPHQITTASAGQPINASATISQAIPFTWSSTDIIEGYMSAPIQGWSSSVKVSDGFDSRVISTTLGLASSQTVSSTSETTLLFTSIINDTVAAYTSNGVRILSSGYYDLSLVVGLEFATVVSEAYQVRLKVDGTTVRTQPINPTIQTVSHSFLKSIYLQAGQVVTGTVQSTTDTSYVVGQSVNTRLTVVKNQSPQTTSMGEVLIESRRSSSGQSFAHSTLTVVQFPTTLISTHNSWDGSTHRFIANKSMKVFVHCSLDLIASETLSVARSISIRKNGSVVKSTLFKDVATTTNFYSALGDRNNAQVSGIVELVSGDYVDITLQQYSEDSLPKSLATSLVTNFLEIYEIK